MKDLPLKKLRNYGGKLGEQLSGLGCKTAGEVSVHGGVSPSLLRLAKDHVQQCTELRQPVSNGTCYDRHAQAETTFQTK